MQAGTPCAKYAALVPVLTERSLRVWAATEARAIGYGGICPRCDDRQPDRRDAESLGTPHSIRAGSWTP
jgi:hypothetical protein